MTNLSAKIAANVRAEIARKGLTKNEAGTAIGLTQPAMSRRLRGEVEFSASELDRLAVLLGLPVAVLFGETLRAS